MDEIVQYVDDTDFGGYLVRVDNDGNHMSSFVVTQSTTIGRETSNDIILTHPTISSKHAKIEIKTNLNHQSAFIIDLESNNFTRIGKQLPKQHPNKKIQPNCECIVNSGEYITFGSVNFIFYEKDDYEQSQQQTNVSIDDNEMDLDLSWSDDNDDNSIHSTPIKEQFIAIGDSQIPNHNINNNSQLQPNLDWFANDDEDSDATLDIEENIHLLPETIPFYISDDDDDDEGVTQLPDTMPFDDISDEEDESVAVGIIEKMEIDEHDEQKQEQENKKEKSLKNENEEDEEEVQTTTELIKIVEAATPRRRSQRIAKQHSQDKQQTINKNNKIKNKKPQKKVQRRKRNVHERDEDYNDTSIKPPAAKRAKISDEKSVVLLPTKTDNISETKLKDLGAVVLKKYNPNDKITHIISSQPRTTKKFICGMATAKYIVTDAWARQCIKKKTLRIDENKYFPNNKETKQFERKYGFKLKESFKKIKEREKPLFSGYKVYFTTEYDENIKKTLAVIGIMAKSHGAVLISRMPRSEKIENEIIVIGHNIKYQQCKNIQKKGYKIYNKDIIITSILRQEIDLQSTHFLLKQDEK